ncbi:hypothetical protein SJI19_02205 [Acerihabitans sp. TG2]|uniref:hypothetical protein n=1 Tax=Acerihabitans sp. TG2 TaxID=3096008 RepID=UPI002B22DB12|nr:hypothetical protein [Acerihabitans sp. TG2]MEA9389376.1 hypothetical protein [Acerihabitans sp. TG2]
MDQVNNHSVIQATYTHRVYHEYVLSWVAYIRPWALFMAQAAIGLIVSQSAQGANFILAGYGILFFAIIKAFYDVALRRRFRFYYDRDGVWVSRGILPWRRGIEGMPWSDINELSCEAGFISWLSKSYTVRLGHRVDPDLDIILIHIKRGNLAVIAINEQLAQVSNP